MGSPPRVRGKDSRGSYPAVRFRITPACAGKRSARRCSLMGSGDHPRVCGEKAQLVCGRIAAAGSPPRVRGKAFMGPS